MSKYNFDLAVAAMCQLNSIAYSLNKDRTSYIETYSWIASKTPLQERLEWDRLMFIQENVLQIPEFSGRSFCYEASKEHFSLLVLPYLLTAIKELPQDLKIRSHGMRGNTPIRYEGKTLENQNTALLGVVTVTNSKGESMVFSCTYEDLVLKISCSESDPHRAVVDLVIAVCLGLGDPSLSSIAYEVETSTLKELYGYWKSSASCHWRFEPDKDRLHLKMKVRYGLTKFIFSRLGQKKLQVILSYLCTNV